MLAPIKAECTNPDWQALFASPQTFLHGFLPLLPANGSGGEKQLGGRERRWSLYHHLWLIGRALKSAPPVSKLPPGARHPLERHVDWVVVYQCHVMVAVHGAYAPSMQEVGAPLAGMPEVLSMAE